MVAVGGIPAFFLRTGSDPFNVPKLALLISAVSLALGIRVVEILQGARVETMQRLLVPASAIAVPLTVSWVFTDYKYWSLFGLFARFQGLIPYLLVVLLGLLIADAFAGRPEELGWAFVVGAAIAGAYSVIQALGLDPFRWQLAGRRTTQTLSTLGNPNFTGGFLGISLPIGIALWLREPHNRSRLTKLLLVVGLGWLLARSEGGLAAGVAGSLIVLGAVNSDRWRKARVAAAAAAIGITVVVVSTIMITVVKPDVNVPFAAAPRGQWWIAAADMGMDSPIVGQGPNTFTIEGMQYRTQRDAETQGYNYTDDPHSVPLALFAGWGLLGVAGYGALVVWVWLRARSGLDLMGWAFVAASVSYFVQSTVSIDELALRAGLWSALGGLAATSVAGSEVARKPSGARDVPRGKKARRRPTQPLRWVPISLAVAALSLVPVVWGVLFVRADAQFQHGLNLFREGKDQAGARSMRRSLSFRDEYLFRHLLGFELGRRAVELEDEDLLASMVEAFSYLNGYPEVPSIRDEARWLHEFDPKNEGLGLQSLALYERAIGLDPHNPLLRVEATRVAVDAGEYDRAIAIGTEVLDDLPAGDQLGVLMALEETARELGDTSSRLGYLEAAIAIDPNRSDLREDAAKLAVELGRYDYAVELTQSVLAGGSEAGVWGVHALALAHLGRIDEAETAISEALAIDENQPLALRARRLLRSRR